MQATLEQLEAAIVALEAQRAILGDATVDAALGPMHDKLAMLRSQTRSQQQQLKAVSVLFADIVGSTAMSRELDPEDIHAIVDGALARFSALVIAHQGRVMQYAGDSMLAAFGADEAHEDDAENAVHAGLAVLEEARRIASEVEVEHRLCGFNVRVGVNTGPVLLGGGVDDEGSIRGITVNIAARMEQSAPEGGLRISHDTYRHVRGVFDVEEQPAIVVKGVAEPLRSYLVQRAKPRAFRIASRGVEGIECPMVGRDVELKRLTDAFEDAIADSALSLITVVGDAGIGKTRLLLEFSNWVELQPQKAWVFQGRAQTHGELLPYGVVHDVFCWRLQIDDSDSLPEARKKLVDALTPIFGDSAEEQAALLGQLIGLDFTGSPFIAGILGDPKQIRDRAFHAAAQYFRRIAQSAPISMLLEDLHWADEGSLDFVNHIAQSCRDLPMQILCAARPSLFERRPLWGSGQRNHERIDLAPLAKRSSRELADALLQRIEQPYAILRELITGGAEGNPFYMEELTKMLIDDGVIVTGADRWQVVPERLAKVHVPPTLVGVLQARLDALPAEERTALQCAAVVGHVFWNGAMAHIDPESVNALQGLMARELIYGRETTAFEGAREFVFKHHVLHQVTYDSVLKRHKREHHRLVAEWLVEQSGERIAEYYALIADHFEKAGDATHAARYLRLAGDDAVKAYANEAALDHLGRALLLTPESDAETRFALLLARSEVLFRKGLRAEHLADAQQLTAIAESLDDGARRAHAAGELTRHAFGVADYPLAVSLGSRAVAWAQAAGVPDAGLRAHSNWVNGLRMLGDHSAALIEAEGLLASAQALGNTAAYLRAMSLICGLATDQGRYDAARDYGRRGLALARETGNRTAEAIALASIGDIERIFGNYAEAVAMAEASLRLYRDIGFPRFEALTHMNVATAMRLQGDPGGALESALRGLAMARETDNADLRAAGANVAADVYCAMGNLSEAANLHAEALVLFREVGRATMALEALVGLARVDRASGRLDKALAHVGEVLAHFHSGGTVEGAEDPLAIYRTCYEILKEANAPRADELLDDGHALLMKRAELLDEAEREGFLHRVPSHRAIVSAYESRESMRARVETVA